MNAKLSRTSVDQLGERLKGELTEVDLRLLDQYRRSFRPDYEAVVNVLRSALGIEVSGRPAKSTTAIVDKLRRGSIRLSQVQDIAGCRVIVGDMTAQDRLVAQMEKLFPCHVGDRRINTSHGYRAVHVIARPATLPIEVQVRTRLQHLWAEVSEKLADRFGIELKYGGGEPGVSQLLNETSITISDQEVGELAVETLSQKLSDLDIRIERLQEMLNTLPDPDSLQVLEKLQKVRTTFRPQLRCSQDDIVSTRQRVQDLLALLVNVKMDEE